jgi:NAD(P)-dependent dehydrogenase (short-subunit alcohol dehydrogenase family)
MNDAWAGIWMAEGLQAFGLEGANVLVTGAGGDIGGALVAGFRAAGAAITGADREDSLLEQRPLDHRIVCDLSDTAAVEQAVARHLAEVGCPDVVVSNAGFTRGELLGQVDQRVWDAELAINLTGAFALTRPILARMAERGGGTLVFIASVNALAHFGNPAYSAAKAGLVAYARSIAVEHGRHGIRANVVCPGSVRTHAWDHRLARAPDLLDKLLPHYPLGRLVTPDEVAQTVLFLASPLSSGITGAVIPVDAGLTAGNNVFVTQVIEGR